MTFLDLLKNKYFQMFLGALLIILVTAGVTYHYTAKYYQDKLDAVQTELTDYKAKYSASVDEREQAIINKAQSDNAKNTPVVAPITQASTATVSYEEKSSADDADVQVSNTTKPVVVSYNGITEALPTTTTQNKEIKDGKVVITQENTAKLDVTDIVNREIANTIDKKDTEIGHLKREKIQNTFWGVVGGFAIGSLAHH